MKVINEPLKNVSVSVTTEKQHVICFFYSDDFKQNSIDFVRDIARLHDNSKEYTATIKMYSDFNKLVDTIDLITDDIISIISFVGMYVNQFLRG